MIVYNRFKFFQFLRSWWFHHITRQTGHKLKSGEFAFANGVDPNAKGLKLVVSSRIQISDIGVSPRPFSAAHSLQRDIVQSHDGDGI